jgi:D-alanyl-D-alanine carboxypeptidase (penicillin-binding protein 5/6)
MTIDNRITAPVTVGESLGTVHVTLGETVVAEKELVALKAVNEGSFWQRIMDEALVSFE